MPKRKINLKSTNWLFILLLSVASLGAQPALVDGVLAVVGKEIVLQSDLAQSLEALNAQNPEQAGAADRCSVFEELLMEKLLLNQAALDSVMVSDEEVEANMNRRIQVFIQQIGSEQRLEQYYGKSIVQIKEEMSELIRNQMTAQMMMQEINGDVKVTPSEVRAFFKSIPTDSVPLINAELEYAEIVKFPEFDQAAEQEAIDKLLEIKERIEGGSSFSTMAVLYSEDPGSARNGGEYKGIKRGQFVKEFEAVAFNLGIGDISEPFRTEYGYHIVQLQMKRGQELDLRHILVKPKIAAANLEAAKLLLDSVRNMVQSGVLSFKDAARQFSDEESTRLNAGRVMNPNTGDTRWATGELDKDIFYAVESLSAGEISEPIFFRTPDEKEGYRLIKLLDKEEAHRADITRDYQRIQEMAKGQKMQAKLEEWVEEKLDETYVRLNMEHLNCDFSRGWIKKTQYAKQ